jgi:hypothetical protein
MRLPKGLSIVTINGLTVAKLYQTNILVIDSNKGTVKFNSGGWLTKHTKKCINLVLGQSNLNFLNVIQRDFEWYVIKTDTLKRQQSVSFQDGLEVTYV